MGSDSLKLPQRAQLLDHALPRGLNLLVRHDAERLAQQFQYRLEWCLPRMGENAGLMDPDTLPPASLGEFETKPALAEAGVADDADTLVALVSVAYSPVRGFHGRKFLLAAGQPA